MSKTVHESTFDTFIIKEECTSEDEKEIKMTPNALSNDEDSNENCDINLEIKPEIDIIEQSTQEGVKESRNLYCSINNHITKNEDWSIIMKTKRFDLPTTCHEIFQDNTEESPIERKRRFAKARRERWLQKQDEDSLAKLRKIEAERQAKKRANETPEEAATRRRADANRRARSWRSRRNRQTPEEVKEELARNAMRIAYIRAHETPEQTARRKRADVERHAIARQVKIDTLTPQEMEEQQLRMAYIDAITASSQRTVEERSSKSLLSIP